LQKSGSDIFPDERKRALYNPVIASRTPPIALITTTIKGGAFQAVKSTKPTKAIPKSPGAFTELVQTGL
jgi:hypothetical protein